ncbi:unnamed protein product, partial [Brenthis ino]
MEQNNLQVIKLHENPQYLKPCCELINDEWPRSETARMMSLQASCDQLPTSLILINDQRLLLGHCKLTAIPSMPKSCFIETVIISKAMRGIKLGTFLMKEVEKYCKNVLRLDMIHLSTKGQENFYAKLGYELCAPVSIYGSSVVNDIKTVSKIDFVPKHNVNINNLVSAPLPPPPPPPPPMPKLQSVNSNIKTSKTFMFKYIS